MKPYLKLAAHLPAGNDFSQNNALIPLHFHYRTLLNGLAQNQPGAAGRNLQNAAGQIGDYVPNPQYGHAYWLINRECNGG